MEARVFRVWNNTKVRRVLLFDASQEFSKTFVTHHLLRYPLPIQHHEITVPVVMESIFMKEYFKTKNNSILKELLLLKNSFKPVASECSTKKWWEHASYMRNLLTGKDGDCRDLRNESRKLRYEIEVSKKWDLYYNNIKLHDRVYEIQVLITYAENMLPQIAKEKKLVDEEKFLTETLMQKCDRWIGVCMEGLNTLDKKLENEQTRDDLGCQETKKEIKLLEEAKANLKNDGLAAWEVSSRLEEIETKLDLNLEFKREVLALDLRCQAINKMDTGVYYKVDPTKGPKKMLTIEEWTKAVYNLVEKAQSMILESMKLRERMSSTRSVTVNEYAIQFDKTDYEMRKRIYEINREKNESQYQLLRVNELMEVTKAEWNRLELFLKDVKDDLRCAETRSSERYFRPSVDATIDPPYMGINQEIMNLRQSIEKIEAHLDILKTFYNKLEEDKHKLILENDAKNKSIQIQVQALDIRIADRYDPNHFYAYKPEILTSKMVTQMPPFFSLYSDHY